MYHHLNYNFINSNIFFSFSIFLAFGLLRRTLNKIMQIYTWYFNGFLKKLSFFVIPFLNWKCTLELSKFLYSCHKHNNNFRGEKNYHNIQYPILLHSFVKSDKLSYK